MTIETPGWGEKRGVATPRRDDDLDRLAAAVLSGGPGADLLTELRKRYFERPMNPDAPEGALRARIAQQQFIISLEQHRDRGLAALAAKPKSA